MPASTRSRSRRDRQRNDPDERQRRNREAQEAAYEAAKVVLEHAAGRRDAEWRAAADGNRRRVRTVLAAPAMLGVVVLLLGIVLPVLLIVGAVLLVGWIVLAAVIWGRASSSLLGQLEGMTPAAAAAAGSLRPLGAERLADLSDGLCSSLGLPAPRLRVIPDRAPNALAVGRRHEDATLVVTAGLVDLLDRIELEAVVAHELAHIKRLDVASAALAASALGRLLSVIGGERAALWLRGSDREIRADLAGVATTRYPPGLIAALERIGSTGDRRPSSVPASVLGRTASSWFAPFDGDSDDPTMDGRLDVLREL
ncbi:MAG: M48 family metallopeptidase [Acidimicrobiales bacterium]